MRHRGVIRKGSRPDDLPALFYLRPHAHVHAQMHADADAQPKNLQTPRHFRSRRTANCSGRHAWSTRTCLRTCTHTYTGASIRARKNLKHHVILVQTRALRSGGRAWCTFVISPRPKDVRCQTQSLTFCVRLRVFSAFVH